MEGTSAPKALGGEVLPPGTEPLQADDPAVIDGHRLTGRLASGGSSVVYLGRDPRGEQVVVKTIRMRKADQTQARRRLRTEAACVRRLPSFCTAPLLVDGSDNSPPYLVRNYIAGPSLAQFVEGLGPLESDRLGALAIALARALAAVHGAGLIHCDLEPTNVLLASNGPRLIDFSIAREAPLSGRTAEVAAVPYNPGWVSPERLSGHPSGPAADIFGWGCLLGYAATGRSPFAGEDTGDGRWSVARAADLAALEEPLRSLVEGALAVDPTNRPSAEDLLAGIDGTAKRETHAARSLPQWQDRDVPPRRAESSVDAPTAPMPAITSAPARTANAFPAEPEPVRPEPARKAVAAPHRTEYAAETSQTEQAAELVPWNRPEPGPPPRRAEYAAETTGARSRDGWDAEPRRRPRRLRTVAMVAAPAAMVAMAATGNGGPTRIQPGGAVTPGQGSADSPPPADPGRHSYGPRPASASSARDDSGSPAAGRHRRRTTMPGAPSRPSGDGHSPGSPPSSKPTPTPTHTASPSPTPTPTGTGPANATGGTSTPGSTG